MCSGGGGEGEGGRHRVDQPGVHLDLPPPDHLEGQSEKRQTVSCLAAGSGAGGWTCTEPGLHILDLSLRSTSVHMVSSDSSFFEFSSVWICSTAAAQGARRSEHSGQSTADEGQASTGPRGEGRAVAGGGLLHRGCWFMGRL